MPWNVLEYVVLFAAAIPFIYYLLAIYSASRYFSQSQNARDTHRDFTPPVSILKPVRGLDPDAYANFASFCRQDYPEYEIIFCVADQTDPSVPVIQKLIQNFPERKIRLLYSAGHRAINEKVAKLALMERDAQYEFLVINDSDVRVEPGYLRTVIAPLNDPKVGGVTCFYVSSREGTFVDKLQTVGMISDFYAGVLVAWQLDGIQFAFGPTMVSTKQRVQAFGGFQVLENRPADDLFFGRLIAEQGVEVKLLRYTVETVPDFQGFGGLFSKRVRWMTEMKALRPWGHFGLLFTWGLPWTTLAFLVHPTVAIAVAYWGSYLIFRVVITWLIGIRGLKQAGLWRKMPLIPLWDALAFFIWLVSFTRTSIRWRGVDYQLRNGQFASASDTVASSYPRKNSSHLRIFSHMTSSIADRLWPSLAILTLLWLAVYAAGLFHPPLFDDADAAHADAGREILTRGDWVTLHENGIRYLEKAPLLYWGMAIAFKLFGVSTFSARLFLHLSVLLLAFFLYQFGRRFLTPEAGFWSAVLFLSSIGPYLFTRLLIPDVTVGLWIGLSLYFFLDGWRSGKPSHLSCWGLAASIALNVLTKGLIGIVFPCAIILVFLLLVGDLRHLLKLRLISSSLVFLLIAAPWHILAALRNPPGGEAKGFLWFYFVNEHFMRYIGKRIPRDYGTVPIFLFYGLLLIWLLPWSAFLPQALAQIRLRPPRIANVRQSVDAVLLLLFCWAAVVLLFFSFSTRQEYYVAPALPALALLLGYWLAREADAQIGSPVARAGRVSAFVLLVAGLLIATITGTLAIISHAPAQGVELVDLLSKHPGVYIFSLGHFLDLTGSAMSLFRGPLTGTALAFLIGTGLNWFLRRRGNTRAANWTLVAMTVMFIECAHIALGVFYPVLGSKPLADAIQTQLRRNEQIICDGDYANASSVNFYTGQQMLIYNGRIYGLWFGSLFPDAPPIFLDETQLASLWSGADRVYFVTGDEKKRDLLAKAAPVYAIAKSNGKFLFSNRPSGI